MEDTEDEVPYDENQHASDVLQELNEFRKAKQNCDFIIKVGSEEIHIHQNILCANSEYFKAMFTHDTQEKQSGCVELKDLDAECVIKCADFMYGRKIKISKEKWEPLMRAADMLQLHKLRRFLADFIGSGLNVESFYKIKDFANTYNCEDLEAKCDKFALKNFEEISKLDGFKQLTMEYISFLLEDSQNETSEMIKLDSVLDWIKFDAGSRAEHLPVFLKNLDLHKIPVEHRRYLLENKALFSQSLDCHKIISASIMDDVGAMAVNMGHKDKSAMASRPTTALKKQLQAIVVFDDTSRYLQCYSPVDDSLKKMHRLRDNMNQDYFSAIVVGDFIYALMETKTVHRLKFSDPGASWEKMAGMVENHGQWPPVVTDGSSLYVTGACSSTFMQSKSVDCYIPSSNRWVILSNKKIPQNITCAYLKQNIYCIGGIRDGKSVQKFDLITREWTDVAPLLVARHLASAVTHFDKIFVLGGAGSPCTSDIERYDSNANSWTKLSHMKMGRSCFNCFVLKGYLYAVGGYELTSCAMEKYDIEEDKWEPVNLLDQKKVKVLSSVGLPTLSF